MNTKKTLDGGVRIGAFSRIDWGSDGFRLYLLNETARIFNEKEGGVHFVVLAGGLISKTLNKDYKKACIKDGIGGDIFISQQAAALARHIPRFRCLDPEKQWATIQLVTSPAYDGELGFKVASVLARKRMDIKHLNKNDKSGEAICPTRREGRSIAVLTPRKRAWLAGEHPSTPIQRVLRDFMNTKIESSLAFALIGGFASDVRKPGGGESSIAYTSVPSLHKLDDSRVGTENQVGVTILEYIKDSPLPLQRVYHLNDLVAKEMAVIEAPNASSKRQEKIVDFLKNNGGAATVGSVANELGCLRRQVDSDFEKLVAIGASRHWPGLESDKAGKRYVFPGEWFKNLPVISTHKTSTKEDRVVVFGCLHAGSKHTDYRFFVDDLANALVTSRANTLIGAGDFVEGLRHNNILTGEALLGTNETDHEKLAAWLVAEALCRAFKVRFGELVGSKKRITNKELAEAVEQSLVRFVYIPGNHCEWSMDGGVSPLESFRASLFVNLCLGIEDCLKSKDFVFDARKIVALKIVNSGKYQLPNTGLWVEIEHPHKGGGKTHSAQAQGVLNYCKSPVAVLANFHTSVTLGRWESSAGQRFGFQIGTMKRSSKFEHGLLKTVDTNFGFARIVSDADTGRIVMTESMFISRPDFEPFYAKERVIETLFNQQYGMTIPFNYNLF